MTKRIVTVSGELSVMEGARWFCSLDNIEMADFLELVGVISQTWKGDPNMQWCQMVNVLLKRNDKRAIELLQNWVKFLNPSEFDNVEKESQV